MIELDFRIFISYRTYLKDCESVRGREGSLTCSLEKLTGPTRSHILTVVGVHHNAESGLLYTLPLPQQVGRAPTVQLWNTDLRATEYNDIIILFKNYFQRVFVKLLCGRKV